MAIRSDKNIEALRIGIAEQERKRAQSEQFEARMKRFGKRERVESDKVVLIPVLALLTGDKLVATDNGTSFYVAATVSRISDTTEDGLKPSKATPFWVSVDYSEAHSGSSGGQAYAGSDRVLVVNTTPMHIRKSALDAREESLATKSRKEAV